MVFRELEARELIDLNVTLAVNLPFYIAISHTHSPMMIYGFIEIEYIKCESIHLCAIFVRTCPPLDRDYFLLLCVGNEKLVESHFILIINVPGSRTRQHTLLCAQCSLLSSSILFINCLRLHSSSSHSHHHAYTEYASTSQRISVRFFLFAFVVVRNSHIEPIKRKK